MSFRKIRFPQRLQKKTRKNLRRPTRTTKKKRKQKSSRMSVKTYPPSMQRS